MCELKLVPLITRENATAIFQQADELKAPYLRRAALDVILNEFNAIPVEDLNSLDSKLLAEIYQEKSDYPLHMAVEHGRNEVVFLLLLSDIKEMIDEKDSEGKSPSPPPLFFSSRTRIALNPFNWTGKTPLGIALEKNFLRIASLV